jgi:hypothetical protein
MRFEIRTMPKRALQALVLVAVLAASFASPAGADIGATIIERCTHGQSLSGFSQQAYRKALQEIPAEVTEYSDCSNLIRKAELAAAGRTAAGTPSGASGPATASIAPPTPTEQTELQQAVHHTGSQPVQIGGQPVVPGVVHADIASAVNSLPTPLLVLLVFLLAIALLPLGRAVWDRARAHRSG